MRRFAEIENTAHLMMIKYVRSFSDAAAF